MYASIQTYRSLSRSSANYIWRLAHIYRRHLHAGTLLSQDAGSSARHRLKYIPVLEISNAIFHKPSVKGPYTPTLSSDNVEYSLSPFERFEKMVCSATETNHRHSDWLRIVQEVIIGYLTTYEAGLRFLPVFTCFVDRNRRKWKVVETMKMLCVFNAASSRLPLLKVPLDKNFITQGIYLSLGAQSTNALRYYVHLLKPLMKDGEDIRANGALQDLRTWVQHDTFHGWDGSRRKQELLHILTGWENDGIGKPNESRQHCLFDIVKSRDLAGGCDYIFALSKLSKSNNVFQEWRHFKVILQKSDFLAAYPALSRLRRKKIFHAFVDAFISADEPEKAWGVYRHSGCKPEMVLSATLDRLLDYPQYITDWHEGMEDAVLQKYTSYIKNIEKLMGIRWSGGEDGCHLVVERNGQPTDRGYFGVPRSTSIIDSSVDDEITLGH